jgi:hypothetical protein
MHEGVLVMNIRKLPLDQIRLDGDTQPRASLDDSVVHEYAERMTEGDVFPPVLVYFDGDEFWLVDGFHRVAAAARAKIPELSCQVRQGTIEDARWECLRSNANHGIRRSREDTGRAIELALQHTYAAQLSNGEIAKHLGVAASTVLRHREKLESTGALHRLYKRLGKDGRLRRLPRRDHKTQSESIDLPNLRRCEAYCAPGENDSFAEIVPHPISASHWIVGVIGGGGALFTGRGVRVESIRRMLEDEFGFHRTGAWVARPANDTLPEWFPSTKEMWAIDHHKSKFLSDTGRLPRLDVAEEWPPAQSMGSVELNY